MKLWVKILIAIASLLFAVSLSGNGYFIYKQIKTASPNSDDAQDTDTTPDTNTADPSAKIDATAYNVIGLMYDSGIDALNDNSLPSADYQVTYLSKNDTGLTVDGFYLLASSGTSTYWGKCVGVAGTVETAWKAKAKIQSSYNRSAIMVTDIDLLPFEECSTGFTKSSNESTYTQNGKTKETIVGTITHTKRPSPDIAYDYKITIPGGYLDKYSASGLNTKVNTMVVSPANFTMLIDIEENLAQSVSIQAYNASGYAESNYFDIFKVTLSN